MSHRLWVGVGVMVALVATAESKGCCEFGGCNGGQLCTSVWPLGEVCWTEQATCVIEGACKSTICQVVDALSCEAFGRIFGNNFVGFRSELRRRSPKQAMRLTHYQKGALRCHYPQSLLDKVWVYYGVTMLDNYKLGDDVYNIWFTDSDAQTMGYEVFLAGGREVSATGMRTQLALIAHELKHTEQYINVDSNLNEFGRRYMSGYCNAGMSYDNNPFEKDAAKMNNVQACAASWVTACVWMNGGWMSAEWVPELGMYDIVQMEACDDSGAWKISSEGCIYNIAAKGYLGVTSTDLLVTLKQKCTHYNTWERKSGSWECFIHKGTGKALRFFSGLRITRGLSFEVGPGMCKGTHIVGATKPLTEGFGLVSVGFSHCPSGKDCGPRSSKGVLNIAGINDDVCGKITHCGSCIGNEACKWCDTHKRCYGKQTSAQCGDWDTTDCCAEEKSCGSCLAKQGCHYCASSSKCYMSHKPPTCSLSFTSTCATPAPTIPVVNPKTPAPTTPTPEPTPVPTVPSRPITVVGRFPSGQCTAFFTAPSLVRAFSLLLTAVLNATSDVDVVFTCGSVHYHAEAWVPQEQPDAQEEAVAAAINTKLQDASQVELQTVLGETKVAAPDAAEPCSLEGANRAVILNGKCVPVTCDATHSKVLTSTGNVCVLQTPAPTPQPTDAPISPREGTPVTGGNEEPSESGSSTSIGLIVGAAVGGGVLLLVIIITVYCCCCRKQQNNKPY